jgi:hypothetical protein
MAVTEYQITVTLSTGTYDDMTPMALSTTEVVQHLPNCQHLAQAMMRARESWALLYPEHEVGSQHVTVDPLAGASDPVRVLLERAEA